MDWESPKSSPNEVFDPRHHSPKKGTNKPVPDTTRSASHVYAETGGPFVVAKRNVRLTPHEKTTTPNEQLHPTNCIQQKSPAALERPQGLNQQKKRQNPTAHLAEIREYPAATCIWPDPDSPAESKPADRCAKPYAVAQIVERCISRNQTPAHHAPWLMKHNYTTCRTHVKSKTVRDRVPASPCPRVLPRSSSGISEPHSTGGFLF